MNFTQVHSFQVFVPEKSGWLKYSQSWAEPDTWLCNFQRQDGKVCSSDGSAATVKLQTLQAQNIWERFCAAPTCETTYYAPAANRLSA